MPEFCSHEDLRRICAETKGVDEANCDRATALAITRAATAIFKAAVPERWPNPSAVESEIDGVIRDIRKLRRRVAALDHAALASARMHAEREERAAIHEAIVAAGSNSVALRNACAQFDEFSRRSHETWVDIAAIRHLDALEDALKGPAAKAVAAAGTGAGRRPDRRAYRTAAAAARAYRDLTGTDPTFWNGGETPFSRMLVRIYQCAGIKADLRKPIEAAMRELRADR